MPQYTLLLYDDPAVREKLNPGEVQTTMGKYMEWGKKPFIRGGQRLAPDAGRVVRSSGGKASATDGPYSETKEVLGGFYIIEAANYDEAVERTMDHPHLEFGTVEVRHVFGT